MLKYLVHNPNANQPFVGRDWKYVLHPIDGGAFLIEERGSSTSLGVVDTVEEADAFLAELVFGP